MANTRETSHKIYSTLYMLVLVVIGMYCVLNATYTAIIGGTTFYFFASVILFVQSVMALRPSEHTRNLAGFGLIVLVAVLLYTHGLSFLSHLKAVALLPAIALTLFGLPALSNEPKKLNALKTILLMSFIILAAVQYYELDYLKGYYDSLHNGETWQKYGAL
ncbi:hypothetical protein [uncultured Acinetobacter sp.]|uniref:hypothetical protein n=1 Tax=uncultured Acinetobacter sp. TaxID=165433 RepID=UPI0025836453|nr:hypothetical protein [uncultured Acinetobacter sp.]